MNIMNERNFNYELISISDIERNSHLIFVCDGNYKVVKVEREENNNEFNSK